MRPRFYSKLKPGDVLLNAQCVEDIWLVVSMFKRPSRTNPSTLWVSLWSGIPFEMTLSPGRPCDEIPDCIEIVEGA